MNSKFFPFQEKIVGQDPGNRMGLFITRAFPAGCFRLVLNQTARPRQAPRIGFLVRAQPEQKRYALINLFLIAHSGFDSTLVPAASFRFFTPAGLP